MRYETIEVDGRTIFIRRSKAHVRCSVRCSGGATIPVERVRLVGPTVGPDGRDGPLVSPETRDAFRALAARERGFLVADFGSRGTRYTLVNVKDDPTNNGRTSWHEGTYERTIEPAWDALAGGAS